MAHPTGAHVWAYTRLLLFLFRFWEPVWYYKAAAKFPKPNFLPGHFVSIAWNHNNTFTYKIWTVPNDLWNKGRELIRNAVKTHPEHQNHPYTSKDFDLWAFDKNPNAQN